MHRSENCETCALSNTVSLDLKHLGDLRFSTIHHNRVLVTPQHYTFHRPPQDLVSTMKRKRQSSARRQASLRDAKGRFVRSPTQHSRFLNLPGELRNQVYRHLLVSPNIIRLEGEDRAQPALLHVSRQLRRESASIYYSENIFKYRVVDMAGQKMLPFRSLLLKYRIAQHHNFKWNLYGNISWTNLRAWLRAYHELRAKIRQLVCRWIAKEGDVRGREKVISAAFDIVSKLRRQPWKDVDTVLEAYHQGLVALNARWT